MSKKAKPPSGRKPSETQDVTSSQIVSTRRSTTHGVGWYAAEDGDDLHQPVRTRSTRWVFVAVFLTVILAGAGAYVWWLQRGGAPVVAPAVVVPDAAPPPPDAAPARMARLSLESKPPGAELVVDGKPVGKAPTELQVAENSKVVVEAKLDAHEPWREEVQVAAKDKKVTAKLVPIPVDAGVAADASTPGAVSEKDTSKKTVKKKSSSSKSSKAKKKRSRRK